MSFAHNAAQSAAVPANDLRRRCVLLYLIPQHNERHQGLSISAEHISEQGFREPNGCSENMVQLPSGRKPAFQKPSPLSRPSFDTMIKGLKDCAIINSYHEFKHCADARHLVSQPVSWCM